jgi:flagellar biosynthesis component FlhA
MCIIKIKGVKILEIKVYLDKILAIGPLSVIKQLNGTPGRYPIYDLSTTWIEQSEENLAQRLECIILKPLDVIAYHLKRIIKENAHKLLDPIILKKKLNGLKKITLTLSKNLKKILKLFLF